MEVHKVQTRYNSPLCILCIASDNLYVLAYYITSTPIILSVLALLVSLKFLEVLKLFNYPAAILITNTRNVA